MDGELDELRVIGAQFAPEGDETAISRDGRRCRYTAGPTMALTVLRAVRRDTYPLGHASHAVVDEHILTPIRSAADEVGGVAPEGDETAISRDGRPAGAAVALRGVRGNAHSLRRAGQAIMDEDIVAVVRIAADEVGGEALEGDQAAIR